MKKSLALLVAIMVAVSAMSMSVYAQGKKGKKGGKSHVVKSEETTTDTLQTTTGTQEKW